MSSRSVLSIWNLLARKDWEAEWPNYPGPDRVGRVAVETPEGVTVGDVVIPRSALHTHETARRQMVAPELKHGRVRRPGGDYWEAWSYHVAHPAPEPALVIRRVRGNLVRVYDLDGDPYSTVLPLDEALALMEGLADD